MVSEQVFPRKLYEALDYSIDDVEASAGAPIALSTDKVEVLMGRMRMPSLSLHGIEGAFYGPGAKTVIPAKVSGKFSIRYQSLALCMCGNTYIFIFSGWSHLRHRKTFFL